ncbi:MAG: tetratricopeptide repeat protein, partial [Bacteroidota bacterium]
RINTHCPLHIFNGLIEAVSNSTVALHAKAEYRWSQDDPLSALELYKTAIIKAPMEEKSYYNAGLVYMELDSIALAYDHFNMAIENSPLYVGAYFYRGYASEVAGNLDAAKRDYEHALRLSPDYERAQEGLARVSK